MDKLDLLLAALIVFIEIAHFVERRDLYNRIMAKDLTEYHKEKKPPKQIENIIKKNMRKNVLGG